MNDGVRRSLLAAKIAQMQAEDARETEREAVRRASRTAESMAIPGWGAVKASAGARTAQVEMPVNSSAFHMMLQRAASIQGSQERVGQA